VNNTGTKYVRIMKQTAFEEKERRLYVMFKIFSTLYLLHKPKYNNNYDRPWKYSILLALIKNYRKYRVFMQKWHTNSRPSDIAVQRDKERKRNSEEQCLK